MGRPALHHEPRVTTALRLPLPKHQRLKVEAARRNLSVNHLVNLAVDDFLDRLLPPGEVRWTRHEAGGS